MAGHEEFRSELRKKQQLKEKEGHVLREEKVSGSTWLNKVTELAHSPELSPHPTLTFTSDGILLLANRAARKMFPEQIDTQVDLAILFPETKDLNLQRIVARDLSVPMKVCTDSSCFNAHIQGVSEFDFLNIYLSDITNIERIKNEIEEDRVETEQLIASIRSILVGLNNEGYVTRWNSAAESAFGVMVQSAIGMHIDACINSWSLGTFDLVEELMEGERGVVIEDARYTKSGQQRESHIDISITRVFAIGDSPSGYLILARDITEKKELEIQLLQAQKLESLGQLAAGIAHEINTPIQFVGDNTHFLDTAFKRIDRVLEISEKVTQSYHKDEELGDLIEQLEGAMKKSKLSFMRGEIPFAIEEALKGLEQVAAIVKGMKQFSHPASGDKRLVSVNECIQDSITVSRNEWKYVADLEADLDSSVPMILCHANEINQVILNLIVNAAHAIENTFEQGAKRKGLIKIGTSLKDDSVVIEIEDSGTGISDEVLPKIFDPFFTTKEPGKGTGQGLSIVHNVIRKHDGTIAVHTSEGKGTVFIIHLPAQVES